MEATVSEIQVENKDEKRSAEVSPQDEKQKEKTSMLCFKRRKKAAKVLQPKSDSEAAEAARKHPLEARDSDQPQRPGGAWASIKGLVTHKKRSDSSKQQKPLEAEVHLQAGDADLSKKKAKSRLKIPCIKFSRGAQKSNHSKIIEDLDCSLKAQGKAEAMDIQTQTQSDDQAMEAQSTQHQREEGVPRKDGNELCELNVSTSITSGENVISVKLELDNGHSAIQTGTLLLEKETETMEEKPSVQSQQASLPESSETDNQQPVAFDATPSPMISDQQTVEKPSNNTPEGEPNWKDYDSRETIVEKENEQKDTKLSQESDSKENKVNIEKPKSEESKRMEPIAIIITDTEVSEFDVKKSKNVPKQFLISIENEQVGFFANDSDFEGRTSEQYETLLIETASSLVKNAIQLSIEQLVNEMASDDNQINTSTVT
ncbi:A-kinase anchor protein 5 [Fukomys damarensis]|uniref:A-kinase anchor protein 5 n=1 Tax=Fukomys damarensis TaxID=885580 RepID=A0A091CZD2_FUKDA|nr:A-kinase anchor protein 5 [Fukomys damarensis]XP_010601320.1 A-kinase anchor protein 5 [Fukomys damarensis]XP_010601321.1 A-kinase anchor protein 5 [Fukomys damarensis]KFO24102.1 A-kinase anchor protein 5 [Fukomys damarensis]